MTTYAMTMTRTHFGLITQSRGKVYTYPLLEVTPLLIRVWSLYALLLALLDLGGAVGQWVGAYCWPYSTLLVVLLSALLWGVYPHAVSQEPIGGYPPK